MFCFSLFRCEVVGALRALVENRQAGDEGDDVAADVVSDSCHGVSPESVVWRFKGEAGVSVGSVGSAQ